MTYGRFITFEGGEGTGKSTQAVKLVDYLIENHIPVIQTREPGGTEGAELIRALLVSGDEKRWSGWSEVLLMYAARVDHWERVIEPALKNGTWVVCDRFSDSTLAYQGYGRHLSKDSLQKLHAMVLPPACTPDQTFIFDLDPYIGIQRSLARHSAETRFEHMDVTFHQRIRHGYQEIAQQNPHRCVLIDADDSIDAVHQKIVHHLTPHLMKEAYTNNE